VAAALGRLLSCIVINRACGPRDSGFAPARTAIGVRRPVDPMHCPLVSVVVPTYRRPQYLRASLASVYDQTARDWELVVADDGSDDETRTLLRSIEAEKGVKVIWLAHSGKPSVVRNAALRAAIGRYVAFLDSDDIWLPQKLALQLEALRARRHCGWSYSAFTKVDASDQVQPEETSRKWLPYDGAIFEHVVRGEASIRTPTVVASRELIAEAGGFDEELASGEDYDLWMRLALRSEVVIVDQSLVRIRHHEANHSNDWEAALIGRDQSIRKLQGFVQPQWQTLLGEERAKNCLKLVSKYLELGNIAGATRAIWASRQYSWAYRTWWSGLAKAVARPYVPTRLLRAYRNLHRP
jgi:glycosyltransferase involved in cell wall biosynthesis